MIFVYRLSNHVNFPVNLDNPCQFLSFNQISDTLDSNYTGMPLNVQVIGKPWQEETVIYAMKQLHYALNGEKL